MVDPRYTVENLIRGSQNLDKMVEEIRFVVDKIMRHVHEVAVSHEGWHTHYNRSWIIGPWVIFPGSISEMYLSHEKAGHIWIPPKKSFEGCFLQPNIFCVQRVWEDLQILFDAILERHPILIQRLAPFIAAASN